MVEKEKVGNMPEKVVCKVVLDTLAARETEVKAHTLGDKLSEVRGTESLPTFIDSAAEN